MGTVILVVGLLLTGYCLLIAAKPEWFKNFRVARHDSDGDYRGSSRLGDSPPGVVRVVYLVVAGILLIGTLVIRSWVIQDAQCDEARAVYESARTDEKWAAAAEQAGFRLEINRSHQVHDVPADPRRPTGGRLVRRRLQPVLLPARELSPGGRMAV
jgi:hypothetical protein